ncbi:TIGR00341 family protein [Methanobacterium petrolearium]|uniref:TIGR00341 family protein n=2 Tax=Methanobacterium petrolearium TaxID=710190 RepID=UPI001AE52423|nr:TIGR00341 family protein [Methanobacterium petrolearium]MBP1946267.1 putative hydrophobic protein (TIGR00271 family) [Methanobacterium petrolearium]
MLDSFGTLLHGDPVDKAEVKRLRDLILFENTDLKKSLVRFFCLLILSSGIATYGLIGNSVAAVIGAMIIAPLMMPIMGLAFGISIGDSRAMKDSLLVSLGGILAAIIVGFLLTFPVAIFVHPQSIDQIMIRTSPKLLDLLAALVTGLAGAFAMSRKDVSDTLPGVAIAISLVPPLSNTGILLATSNFSLAMGSFLLFLTNYFAILLTGAALYGVMGFPKVAFSNQSFKARRKGISIALILILLITVPLAYTSYESLIDNTVKANVYDESTTWLNGTGYIVASVDTRILNNTVVVALVGDGNLPPIEELQQSLQGKLYGRTLRVEVVNSTVYNLDN